MKWLLIGAAALVFIVVAAAVWFNIGTIVQQLLGAGFGLLLAGLPVLFRPPSPEQMREDQQATREGRDSDRFKAGGHGGEG